MILSYFILILSAFTILLGFSYLKDSPKNKKRWNYFFTALGSTIWGIGFGLLLVQKNDTGALICRAIGMIGVFMYAIFGAKIMTIVADTPKLLKNIVTYFTYLGIILYPFVIMPARQEFYIGQFGMSYTFANDIWNTLYNLYSVVVLVLFFIILVKMRKDAVYKRQKVMNNGLWLFFICFSLGSALDTTLPMLGIGAFPGSTISQFFSIFIVHYFLTYEKKNTLDIDNVSNHLYHSIDMPILVLNNDMNIEFVSDSAYRYFDIIRGLEKDTKVSDLFSLDANVDIEEIINKCITVDCYIKNSENYCSIFVDLIKDTFDDIIGYVMIITDLTEKYKKDTEIVHARDNAEELSKSKDQLLDNVSFDIKLILKDIIDTNELISKEERIDSIRSLSSLINASSIKALDILDNLEMSEKK